MQSIVRLDDDALLASLQTLVRGHRSSMSRIVAHLGEVEERRLHAARGHSSLFVYCVKELAFSEDEACRRIEAARLARRFPRILPMLEDGAVSLSVLGLLKHRIDATNERELLDGVARKSVQRAKEWLAARFPSADQPEAIRKLPGSDTPRAGEARALPAPPPIEAREGRREPPPPPPSAPTPPRSARVKPLSAERFSVKLTVSRSTRDKLERARDLARHRLPSGKLEELLELALDALLDKLEHGRFGKTRRPEKPARPSGDAAEPATPARQCDPTPPPGGRRTPSRPVRREVLARDGERCAFVAPDGTRCECRAYLEFDHVEPVGLGGTTDAANLRLLCRSHNALAAERIYGREFMAQAIAKRRSRALQAPSA